jgi:putative flippase GtrA
MIAGRSVPGIARAALSTAPTTDPPVQLVRYAIVAGVGYLLALAVYAGELAVGVRPYPAVAVIFVLNGIFNFVGVRRWAFPPSGRTPRSEGLRFTCVAALSLVVNYSCFACLYSLAGVPATLAQAVAIAVAAPVGFVANRLWSFRRRPAG